MLIVPMFGRQFYNVIVLAVAVALGASGCASNKKQQAAASETAPPAAAYPAGEAPPASDGADSATVPPAHNYGGSNPSKPQPFQLRPNEQLVVYQIGSGDTLGVIAKKYGTTASRIMAANGMTSDKIFAGKTIQVPTVPAGSVSNNAGPGPVVVPSPASTPGYASTQTPAPADPAPVLKPLPYGGTTSTGNSAGNTNPYVGPADSSGLPSVSSSGSTGSGRNTTPIPPVKPAPKPAPATSGSAFPTPSFSSGN